MSCRRVGTRVSSRGLYVGPKALDPRGKLMSFQPAPLTTAVDFQARQSPFRSQYWSLEARPYSVRKACMGSIRDALHAGTRQARAATANRVAATDAKTAGSSGLVP